MSFPLHRSKRLPWLLAASIVALSTSAASAADDADTAESDIVVTGQRDERLGELQKTPLAITSLSGARLEQSAITATRELDNIVPNLYQARTVVSYLNARFFIRGVGEADEQGEPSVPVYQDGIYIPKNLGSQSELLDIDRVEIFRGPQGQAFGHTAAGGAVVITSTVPDETPQFKASASIGTYFDRRLGVAASGPLGGDVFGSVAVSYHGRDGFDKHVASGRDVNTVDYLAGRTKLRWTPTDDLDIILSLYGVRDRSSARGVQDLLRSDRNAYNQLYPEQRFDQLTGSVRIAYDLDDHLQLTSLFGVYGWQQVVLFDNVGEFYGRGSQWVDYRDRTYQEELQLKGTYDRFSFTTGIYLFHEWWFTNRRANTAAAFNPGNIANSNNPAQVRYNPVYTEIRQKTDNIAWYGEGKYGLTDALTLTAGLRFNYERHSNNNQLYTLATGTVDPSNFYQILFSAPKSLVWSVNPHKTWTTWQPRVSVDYRLSPDATLYGTIARGTKSAGYEFRAQTASAAGRNQAELPFNPEIVTSYEIGLKSKWLDGKVTANLTGFYLTFDDIQITTTDSQNAGINRRFNAGKGSSRGVEFEGQFVPVDGLAFDVNGAYLDARLDEYIGAVNVPTVIPANAYYPTGASINNQPFVGARLANAPKWQGRAAVTWDLPVAISGNIVVNADVNYQSTSFTSGNNAITTKLPRQTLVNARLSYTTEDGRWSAALSARNLLDKQYAMGAGYTIDGSTGAARLPAWRAANLTDPRTVLFTITFRR